MKNLILLLFLFTSFPALSQTQPRANQIRNTPAGGISATNVQTALNELDTEKSNLASPTFTGTPAAPTAATTTNTTQVATTAFVQQEVANQPLIVLVTDQVSTIGAGAGKVFIPISRARTVTSVKAYLITAQASGSIFTVDINENGTTILSTKLTIDNTESNSTTAATAAVISDASLAANSVLSFDVDQIGNGSAIGLMIIID